MKSIVSAICWLTVFFLFTASLQGKQTFREIVFSKTEAVSHLKDIEYRANPRFTPAPDEMDQKVFLKNPVPCTGVGSVLYYGKKIGA